MNSRILFATVLCFIPQVAWSHVRWFAPTDLPPVNLPSDSISTALIQLVLSVVIFTVALRCLVNRLSLLRIFFLGEFPFAYRWLWYLLLGLINLFMLINLLFGEFLAPNLVLPLDALILGVIAQAAIVIVMPWSVSLVGVLIIIVTALLFVTFPSNIVIDYVFEFAGIGLALILVGPSLNKNDAFFAQTQKWDNDFMHRLGVHVLRISLGIQLIELALHNKLLNPESALWFIEHSPFYNFFPALGFPSVTNLHFVLFVGISELALGALLVINIACRAALIALMTAFTLTAILSGAHELTGHIPIFGVMFILFAECPLATGEQRKSRHYLSSFAH